MKENENGNYQRNNEGISAMKTWQNRRNGNALRIGLTLAPLRQRRAYIARINARLIGAPRHIAHRRRYNARMLLRLALLRAAVNAITAPPLRMRACCFALKIISGIEKCRRQ
jgi:hypothetical protein